jgi:hypothetical protein
MYTRKLISDSSFSIKKNPNSKNMDKGFYIKSKPNSKNMDKGFYIEAKGKSGFGSSQIK